MLPPLAIRQDDGLRPGLSLSSFYTNGTAGSRSAPVSASLAGLHAIATNPNPLRSILLEQPTLISRPISSPFRFPSSTLIPRSPTSMDSDSSAGSQPPGSNQQAQPHNASVPSSSNQPLNMQRGSSHTSPAGYYGHPPNMLPSLPDHQQFAYHYQTPHPYAHPGSHFIQHYSPQQQQTSPQLRQQRQEIHHVPLPSGMVQQQPHSYSFSPQYHSPARGASSPEQLYQPVMTIPFQHPAASGSIHQGYSYTYRPFNSTPAQNTAPASSYSGQSETLGQSGIQSPHTGTPHSSPESNLPTASYPVPVASPTYTYSPHSLHSPSYSLYHSPYTGPYPPSTYFNSPTLDHQKGSWWSLPSAMGSVTGTSAYEQSPLYQYPPSNVSGSKSVGRHQFSSAEGQMSRGGDNIQPPLSTEPAKAPEALISSLSLSSVPRSPSPDPYAPGFAPVISTSPLAGPLTRRAYHPNPPTNRSAWVMWVGNVPSDATNEELWSFFNRRKVEDEAEKNDRETGTAEQTGGVSSVFLISRSNCAFINFETGSYLEQAVRQFDGALLRPQDPRCLKLVCRIRKASDDLKAGVGGQRGMGMHTKYIREQKTRSKTVAPVHDEVASGEIPSSPQDRSISSDISWNSSGDPRSRQQLKHSSSSGSYASTTSSFLTKYFPKRYFILKSLTEEDLNLSVQRGMWATQSHNEPVLDQAFHSSNDVYLIFSANKSGEFFGYARMTGAIRPNDSRVQWTDRSGPGSLEYISQARPSMQPSPIAEEELGEVVPERAVTEPTGRSMPPVGESQFFLSPSIARVENSPGFLTPREEERIKSLEVGPSSMSSPEPPVSSTVAVQMPAQTAPAEMDQPHDRLSYNVQPVKHGTTTGGNSSPNTKGEGAALEQAMLGPSKREPEVDEEGIKRKDTYVDETERQSQGYSNKKNEQGSTFGGTRRRKSGEEEDWGTPFAIEWIRTDKLSFQRTRHLRNPWNHDREIKVSRDGTELEPSVGETLLEEWERAFPSRVSSTANAPP